MYTVQHSVCLGHSKDQNTRGNIIAQYIHTILGRVKHTTHTPLEKDVYIQTQHINWSLLFRVTHLRDMADVSLHLAQVLHLFVQELQHTRGQHVHLVVLLRVLQCLSTLPRLDAVPLAVVGQLVYALGVYYGNHTW